MVMMKSPRGFTLLVAIIFASVSLAIGIALADVAIKQSEIGISAKASQMAFYNADSGLECAQYWDYQDDAFDYSGTYINNKDSNGTNLNCEGDSIPVDLVTSATQGNPLVLSFTIPCPNGDSPYSASVTIYKAQDGSAAIYSLGSSCEPGNVVIRGIKAAYGTLAS